MKTYNFKQGSEEWRKVRLGKLTASNAQAIAARGRGLDSLAFEKAAEILTGKPKTNYINSDIDRGNELEHLARNAYEIETGNKVVEVGFCEMDETAGASPDGFVGKKGIVEIKCKNDANFVKFLYDQKVDPAHNYQMQMQMFITDREWVDYVLFNENFTPSISIKRVERNDFDIAKIKGGLAFGLGQIKTILEKVKNGKSK